MISNKKVIVVMPAYNAELTLRQTYQEIDRTIVDDIILVDDGSRDFTVSVARELGIQCYVHERNRGYGGNQKTCYAKALEAGADIVIMLHPDYQYTPKLIPAFAGMLVADVYDVVLGSRILGGGALKGGMPLYKYVFNRILTAIENLFTGLKLSEYHTGYRAFTKEVLQSIALEKNSDDFIFDNQMLLQIAHKGLRIAEVSCPTKYFPEASSINFSRSTVYGLGCLFYGFAFWLAKRGIRITSIFG